MRLWSIHPKYLDSKGLVALWREALLAKKVLQNKTKGYKNHPQLERFKKQSSPITFIDTYLKTIYDEAKKRNFNFDKSKMGNKFENKKISVTSGQIEYEFKHLLQKLKERDTVKFNKYKYINKIEVNPLVQRIPGNIEDWEKLKP